MSVEIKFKQSLYSKHYNNLRNSNTLRLEQSLEKALINKKVNKALELIGLIGQFSPVSKTPFFIRESQKNLLSTAIQYAPRNCIIKRLLKYGATNTPSFDGKTPLELAVRFKRKAVVKLLKEKEWPFALDIPQDLDAELLNLSHKIKNIKRELHNEEINEVEQTSSENKNSSEICPPPLLSPKIVHQILGAAFFGNEAILNSHFEKYPQMEIRDEYGHTTADYAIKGNQIDTFKMLWKKNIRPLKDHTVIIDKELIKRALESIQPFYSSTDHSQEEQKIISKFIKYNLKLFFEEVANDVMTRTIIKTNILAIKTLDSFQYYFVDSLPLGQGSHGSVYSLKELSSNQISDLVLKLSNRQYDNQNFADSTIKTEIKRLNEIHQLFSDQRFETQGIQHSPISEVSFGNKIGYIGKKYAYDLTNSAVYSLSFEERKNKILPLISAISNLHKIDRCHLDIKPNNCCYDENEATFRLCDWEGYIDTHNITTTSKFLFTTFFTTENEFRSACSSLINRLSMKQRAYFFKNMDVFALGLTLLSVLSDGPLDLHSEVCELEKSKVLDKIIYASNAKITNVLSRRLNEIYSKSPAISNIIGRMIEKDLRNRPSIQETLSAFQLDHILEKIIP